jgi:hypothetical protein
MLNPKTHLAPLPCQQRDVDICSALMGKPIGQTKLEDIQAESTATPIADPAPTHVDLTPLLLLPTNKVAMKAWVKHVQSTVVQVSENVKHRVNDASDHMKTRMGVVGEQVKHRMADSAVQAAKRMRKAG